MQRILDFLSAEESAPYIVRSCPEGDEKCVILLEDLTMAWALEETASYNSEVEKEADIIVAGSELDTTGVELLEKEGKELGEDRLNRSLHTLMDLNLRVEQGMLVAVVGPVGCGKSSLLNCLIGELLHKKGRIHVNGSIAYCDQKVWIMNATLKDNILFGQEFDERRFDIAIHAASLEDDLKVRLHMSSE